MPKFKDKDEFLDALWEHLELEDNSEDDVGFFEHLSKFFADDSNSDDSGGGNSGRPNSPRRRRRPTTSSTSRRPRAGSDSGFGNTRWFGQ